jgi:acetyltransferase
MTYVIAQYPEHLIEVVRLAGGGRVTIRPTVPQDMELQRAFFRSLSAEARYCRFLTRCNALPETLVERFSSTDHLSHLALMAVVLEGGGETMIGEARCVIDASDPATCEFAIAVADAWQYRGLAKTMLGRLQQHAALCGVRRMVADTLVTNAAMLGLARSCGFAISANRADASLATLQKHLNPSAVPLEARPLAA